MPSTIRAVAGNAIARTRLHDVADTKAVGRQLDDRTILLHPCRAGDQIGQGLDTGAGLPGGDILQHLADRKQQHDDRSFLGGADHDRTERGCDHQRLDGERSAGQGHGHRATAKGEHGNQSRCNEDPVGLRREQQRGAIGHRDQRAQQPHQPGLAGPPPGNTGPLFGFVFLAMRMHVTRVRAAAGVVMPSMVVPSVVVSRVVTCIIVVGNRRCSLVRGMPKRCLIPQSTNCSRHGRSVVPRSNPGRQRLGHEIDLDVLHARKP